MFENRVHVEGIVRESAKLLVDLDRTQLVYDLAADPDEQYPDPPALEATAATLSKALDETKEKLARQAGDSLAPEQLDDATKESLRALGYEP
jgi:hypothetical protein